MGGVRARPQVAEGPGAEPLLRLDDLKVHFPVTRGLLRHTVGVVQAVDGVSLSLARGETLGLVGESGSGKTTLGRTIIRLYAPTAGSIHLEGIDLVAASGGQLRALRQRMQMIFQDPFASLHPRMSVEEIVAEPLDIHRVGTRSERRDRVRELLRLVGLKPEHATRYPQHFSGGERQRIGIARALALHPELVIADEPVSALDVSVQAQVMNLLRSLQRELHLTYLFIAHDLSVIRRVSDRVAVMYLGRIVESAPTQVLFGQTAHPYTVALLSAVPVPDPEVESKRKRIMLRGDLPSPMSPPSGCRFHTRCWLSERLGNPAECAQIDPPLREFGPDHVVACHFADQTARMPVGGSP